MSKSEGAVPPPPPPTFKSGGAVAHPAPPSPTPLYTLYLCAFTQVWVVVHIDSPQAIHCYIPRVEERQFRISSKQTNFILAFSPVIILDLKCISCG